MRALTLATLSAVAAAALTGAGGAVTDAATVVCPTVGAGGVVTPAPSERVDWSGCDLAGANMSGADLEEVDFNQANLDGANLSGATLLLAGLDEASLDGASLSGASLRSAGLKSADLTDADLTNAVLNTANIRGANLSGADFTGANLSEVISGTNTASPAPTLPTNWELDLGYLIGPGSNLDGAALSGADLSGFDLDGAFLSEANLSAANLTGANLSSTDLSATNMTGANLTTAVFSDAGLDEANLSGANVSGADFSRAELTGVESGALTATSAPMLPANWALASGFLAGPGVDLQLANASGADFAGLDLDGANLYGAYLADANLSHANLTSIQGAGLNLTDANLTDANLTDATIAYDAFGAGAPTLQGADLAGATLTGLNGALLAGGPAVLPAHWKYVDGFMLGPFANLNEDAALDYQDLTGVDLAFAYLPYLEFQHDILTGASFWGSDAQAGDFYEDTWSDTTCPDGSNSNDYVAGCFSTRLYEFPGLISPRDGSTLRKSARRFTVTFRLEAASGGAISSAEAASLAAKHGIESTLTGPRIKATTIACSWSGSKRYFSCTFRIPSGVRTGSRYSYSITVRENQGGGFVLPPLLGRAVNPERVHFR